MTLKAPQTSEPPAELAWWHHLGALLPVDVRERVFEPACYEYLRRHIDLRRSHLGIGAYALAVLLGSAALNLPGSLLHDRRLTGLGRIVAAATAVLVLAWIALRFGYAYAYATSY